MTTNIVFQTIFMRMNLFLLPQMPKCVKMWNKIGAFRHLFTQILVIRVNQTDLL